MKTARHCNTFDVTKGGALPDVPDTSDDPVLSGSHREHQL